MTTDATTLRRLSVETWQGLRAEYQDVVFPWVERRRFRRSRGLKHPVEDFLWEYYSLRGGRLLQWSPGAGVWLERATEQDFPEHDGYREMDGGRYLDEDVWLTKRQSGVRWILNLLQKTRDRKPAYSCLGLHEWAMVYEWKDVRHDHVPLRLRHAETRKVVESFPLQCTHYDAFRFFSTEARLFNPVQLQSEDRAAYEQPGCLHANMDLFKWCMKLQPLVPSSLTAKTFNLACEARDVDMRASPYDLREMGYAPICIETAEGRKEYMQAQRDIAEKTKPLRQELIEVLGRVAGE
jgi:hypothetical protein